MGDGCRGTAGHEVYVDGRGNYCRRCGVRLGPDGVEVLASVTTSTVEEWVLTGRPVVTYYAVQEVAGSRRHPDWVPDQLGELIPPVETAEQAAGLESLRELLTIFEERGAQVKQLLDEREALRTELDHEQHAGAAAGRRIWALEARVKELESELAPDMEEELSAEGERISDLIEATDDAFS